MSKFRVGQKVRIKSEEAYREGGRENDSFAENGWGDIYTIRYVNSRYANRGTSWGDTINAYRLQGGNNWAEKHLVAIGTIKDKLSEVLKDV